MAITKIGSLEIEDQAKSINNFFRKIQDGLIICLFVILIFAFLGFTGSGFFADKTIEEPTHTISANIPLYLRTEANSTLYFLVDTTKLTLTNNTIVLYVDHDYLKHFYIKQILPEPYSIQANNNKIYYFFHSNSKAPTHISFVVEPIKMGYAKAIVGVDNKEIMFKQFIYP